MKRRIVLKLSGEALAGKERIGISHQRVNEIADDIKELYDLGDIELSIVVGAGNIWRGRDALDSGMERSSLCE